jgi:hypothetical protein
VSAAELACRAFVTRQSKHTVLQGLQDRGLLAQASRTVADVEHRMLHAMFTGNVERLRQDPTPSTQATRDINPPEQRPQLGMSEGFGGATTRTG